MGGLGDLVETLRPRRSGSIANVHVERLAASWANEPAPWLVEEAIPRRLIEFDHGDRVGRHATPIVEERDLARFTIEAKVPALASIAMVQQSRPRLRM
jgi:hypothetical protein